MWSLWYFWFCSNKCLFEVTDWEAGMIRDLEIKKYTHMIVAFLVRRLHEENSDLLWISHSGLWQHLCPRSLVWTSVWWWNAVWYVLCNGKVIKNSKSRTNPALNVTRCHWRIRIVNLKLSFPVWCQEGGSCVLCQLEILPYTVSHEAFNEVADICPQEERMPFPQRLEEKEPYFSVNRSDYFALERCETEPPSSENKGYI